MARQEFRTRLAQGRPLVMDGAMGSELQRRGVWVSHGATDTQLGAWSATAMRDAPEVVREVHDDYFKVGADIAITNSFWTNSVKLGLAGLADKAEEYTRLSAQIAAESRDRLRPDAYVAGGMAPPLGGREEIPVDREHLPREFAMQARALKDGGADVILVEYMGHVEDVVAAVDAVSPTGLPVLVGLRHIRKDGAMQHGESYGQLVDALGERKVDAILLMCSHPEAISAGLPLLRKAYDGAIGAYPNHGYGKQAHKLDDKHQWHSLDTESYSPAHLAADGTAWLAMGAQIIGGCCSTTPDHIAALRKVVPGA